MDNVNEKLRNEAVNLGLCDKWQSEWKESWDKQKLIDKFYEGLDFCIINHYPSNEFIKRNFDRDLLRKNGLLVDDEYSLLNPKQSILLGTSKSTVRVNAMNVSRIWVRDISSVKIIARGYAGVIVHVLDSTCSVKLVDERIKKDDGGIVVIVHSENDNIELCESAMLKKELGLYD